MESITATTTPTTASTLLVLSIVSVIQQVVVVICDPAPGGFLLSGRPIQCERNRPIDIGRYIPAADESVRRCYGCSCPNGIVDCRRINEAEECQLGYGRPKVSTTKKPYPNMDIPDQVLAHMAQSSRTLGLDLDSYYKKYSKTKHIAFSPRPTTTTTMAPQQTESEEDEFGNEEENSSSSHESEEDNDNGSTDSEQNSAKPVDDITSDVDVVDEPQIVKFTPSTTTTTTTTTTTPAPITSTTTEQPTTPTRSHDHSQEFFTKPSVEFSTGPLSTESIPSSWDDPDLNNYVTGIRIRPSFSDEMRLRNQRYRSYKSDQERGWMERNGATMAEIALYTMIVILSIILVLIAFMGRIVHHRNKQLQVPPDPIKSEPIVSVSIQ